LNDEDVFSVTPGAALCDMLASPEESMADDRITRCLAAVEQLATIGLAAARTEEHSRRCCARWTPR
jgi:hypothetical protein